MTPGELAIWAGIPDGRTIRPEVLHGMKRVPYPDGVEQEMAAFRVLLAILGTLSVDSILDAMTEEAA